MIESACFVSSMDSCTVDGLVHVVLARAAIAPGAAHRAVVDVPVDRRQFGGESVVEDLDAPQVAVFAPVPLPAGVYQLCMFWGTDGSPLVVSLDELAAEIGGEPEPPTTTPAPTTPPAPTTTTVPDVKPVTPRYTG